MTYLLIGDDPSSKDTRLQALRKEFIAPGTEEFNIDTLYAGEISLADLQEKLLSLPVNSPHRIVVLKKGRELKSDCREFLAGYVKKPYKGVVLVIDIEPQEERGGLVSQLQRWSRVVRFRENERPDTFSLNRQIEAGRADSALRTLRQLLEKGEKPERIMGGLRYSWMKNNLPAAVARQRLRSLLCCDKEIKAGLLEPAFALEKLIVGLCSLGKPLH